MEVFLFYFCGALMVLAGVMMVLSRNAVAAACWLIFAFINAAGIYATLSAPFLAVLQVLVDTFQIAPIATADEDLAEILGDREIQATA